MPSRLRLTFSKTSDMRFTGHMDLHRSLDRTLRRAGFPLTTTQGYTRRTKLQIASALPLGVTGGRELADIWLDEPVPEGEFKDRFSAAAPPGIRLLEVEEVAADAPKLQNAVRESAFTVTLLDPLPGLEAAVEKLLAAETLPRERRGKPYDLRPLVLQLEILAEDEEGLQRLGMTLQTREGATGRPDEVLAALGADPAAARYHREHLTLAEPHPNP